MRHRVELAYAQGELWARCRCGWEGTAYELAVNGHDGAYQAAERDAREHEQAQAQTAERPMDIETIASWRNLAACLGMDPELWFPLWNDRSSA
jgi:hypothetical protein